MLFTKTKNTSDIVKVLKELKEKLKRISSLRIAYVHYDNSKSEFGLEFQDSIREVEIQVKPCPLYKYFINRVTKCYIRLVNKVARSMLYKSKINSNF